MWYEGELKALGVDQPAAEEVKFESGHPLYEDVRVIGIEVRRAQTVQNYACTEPVLYLDVIS